MYNKILLTTDGSKNSERAIEHAYYMASTGGAELIVLNVVDDKNIVGLPEDTLKETIDAMDEQGKSITKQVTNIIENINENHNLKITPKTVEGNPAATILKIADEEDVDIIIMASSGKHMIDRFLLGSVTEKTVRHSKVPVLVIPTKD